MMLVMLTIVTEAEEPVSLPFHPPINELLDKLQALREEEVWIVDGIFFIQVQHPQQQGPRH